MKQYPQPWKNKAARSDFYYFTYTDTTGRRRIKSTGTTSLRDARGFIHRFMAKLPRYLDTLAAYAEPFYNWEECPHIRRLLDEGKSIGKDHAAHRRATLKKYVLTDKLAAKRLADITRGDVLDYRTRIRLKHGDSMANRTMGVLKTVFKEALYREDIERDPTVGVGNIKVESRVPGTFTHEELAFAPDDWPDERERVCFMLAAFAALRRGEILALRWMDVDDTVLRIRKARKGHETGPPKWGRVRVVALSDKLRAALEHWRGVARPSAPEHLVISWDDGTPIATRTINAWFDKAMKRLDIDKKARRLTPHSYRHTRITLWKQAGMPADALRAMVGHTEEKTTEGYVHYSETYLADIVKRFG